MATYLLFRLAGVAIPRLPEKLGRKLFEWLAAVLYYFARGSRRAVHQNLTRVLPGAKEEEVDRVARGVFRHSLLNYYDLLCSYRLGAGQERLYFQGEDNLRAAQGMGKGIIIATAHLGSINLLRLATVHFSWKGVVLTEPLLMDGLDRLTDRLRSSSGIRAFPARLAGLKEAFRSLKRGEIVIVACDRAIQGTGVRMPFMGQETLMPNGAVELAARTGAPLLPAFGLRDEDGGHKLLFEPPFTVGQNGNATCTPEEGLARVARAMEDHIRTYPEQWVVFSPIWSGKADE